MGSRFQVGHGFLAVPVAFELQSLFVQPAATVAMAEFVGIEVLKGLLILIHWVVSLVIRLCASIECNKKKM